MKKLLFNLNVKIDEKGFYGLSMPENKDVFSRQVEFCNLFGISEDEARELCLSTVYLEDDIVVKKVESRRSVTSNRKKRRKKKK